MHGGREPTKVSKWPNLCFPLDESLPYETIVDLVQSKSPRLLIAFADSCNGKSEKLDDDLDQDEEEFEEEEEGEGEELTMDDYISFHAKKGPATHNYTIDKPLYYVVGHEKMIMQ